MKKLVTVGDTYVHWILEYTNYFVEIYRAVIAPFS